MAPKRNESQSPEGEPSAKRRTIQEIQARKIVEIVEVNPGRVQIYSRGGGKRTFSVGHHTLTFTPDEEGRGADLTWGEGISLWCTHTIHVPEDDRLYIIAPGGCDTLLQHVAVGTGTVLNTVDVHCGDLVQVLPNDCQTLDLLFVFRESLVVVDLDSEKKPQMVNFPDLEFQCVQSIVGKWIKLGFEDGRGRGGVYGVRYTDECGCTEDDCECSNGGLAGDFPSLYIGQMCTYEGISAEVQSAHISAQKAQHLYEVQRKIERLHCELRAAQEKKSALQKTTSKSVVTFYR